MGFVEKKLSRWINRRGCFSPPSFTKFRIKIRIKIRTKKKYIYIYTYVRYLLTAVLVIFLTQIRNQITDLWQSKRQRVQVHSSMNTTSKASNAFEAFFGIHELPPPRILSSSLKAWKLHWHNPMTNIGIDLLLGYGFHSNVMAWAQHGRGLTRKHHRTLRANLSLSLSLCSVLLSLSFSLLLASPRYSSRDETFIHKKSQLFFALSRVSWPPVSRLFVFVHDDDDADDN